LARKLLAQIDQFVAEALAFDEKMVKKEVSARGKARTRKLAQPRARCGKD
jgi:hypothetical protein